MNDVKESFQLGDVFFYHFCHPNIGWSVKINDVKESAWWEATHPFSNAFYFAGISI